MEIELKQLSPFLNLLHPADESLLFLKQEWNAFEWIGNSKVFGQLCMLTIDLAEVIDHQNPLDLVDASITAIALGEIS